MTPSLLSCHLPIKYSCKLRGRYIDTFPTLDELAQQLVVRDRGGFLRLLFQRQPSVEASILQAPPPPPPKEPPTKSGTQATKESNSTTTFQKPNTATFYSTGFKFSERL